MCLYLADVDHSDPRTSAQLEEVLSLITQKLKTMINAGDSKQIYSKRKAITVLFPYAVWQKRDGRHDTFDMFLHAVCASKDEWGFMWGRIKPFVVTLLGEDSHVSLKQDAILVSPHLPWRGWNFAGDKHLVQLWAAAALVVPSADRINQSIVDTLLQIASNGTLRPHIPIGVWSLLNKRSSLPPICYGRNMGSRRKVAQTIRALGDAETLTSYLLLVWSEWDWIYEDARDAMSASVREDLSGIGMGHHREELLHHLDQIFGQLDLGLRHLQRHKPNFNMFHIWMAREHYGMFREVVLEVDEQATRLLTREFPLSIVLSCLLTAVDSLRIALDVYVRIPSPVPLVVCVVVALHCFPRLLTLPANRFILRHFMDLSLFPYILFAVPEVSYRCRTDSDVDSGSDPAVLVVFSPLVPLLIAVRPLQTVVFHLV